MLEIVSALPPAFRPSIVALSAPLRLISAEPAIGAPEMVLAAPPTGLIAIEVYEADPEPLAFSAAVAFGQGVAAHLDVDDPAGGFPR